MTSKITSFGTGCLDLEKVYYYSETELQKKGINLLALHRGKTSILVILK